MTKRKSFAGRVKAASKRTSSRPATNAVPQTTESPATARLRTREIAADPEGTFVPTSTTTSAKPIRDAKAARLAKRVAAETPTSTSTPGASSSDASRLPPPASRLPRPQAEPDRGYVAVGRVLGPFGLKGELKVLPLTDNPDRFAPKSKLYAALAQEAPAPARLGAREPGIAPASPDPTSNISNRVAAGDQHPTSPQTRRDPQSTPSDSSPSARVAAGDQSPVSSPQPVTVLRSREASGHLYVTLKGYPDRDSTDKFRHALLQVPESDLPPLPDGEYYRFQLIGLTVVDTTGAVLGTLDEIIETGSNDVYRVHPPEGADVLLPALADVVVSTDLAERRMVVDPPDWR